MLQNLGARAIFSAQDGLEALEVLRHIDPPIDVIVTDLNMPGMDGIEFIRHAGDMGIGAAFILASEQERALVASVARMASAYGVRVLDSIQKPVTGAKLSAALAGYRPAQGSGLAKRAPPPRIRARATRAIATGRTGSRPSRRSRRASS